jgi:hypothetical protein
MAETIHVLGEGGVVWSMDLPLPDGVASRLAKGELRRVTADGSPWVEPAEAAETGAPGRARSGRSRRSSRG